MTQIAGVTADLLPAETVKSPVPRLEIRWDGRRTSVTGLELREQLLSEDPRIMLDDRGATDCSVFILPFSLRPGEAAIVGDRIRKVLAKAPEREPEDEPNPVQIAGTWELEIDYPRGKAHHRVTIEQDGRQLTGSHETLFLSNPLRGQMRGEDVEFTSMHRFEGTHLSYRFTGTAADGQMSGTVEVGSSGQSAPGPFNQREYGTAPWRGRKTNTHGQT